tara:strand:+ start:1282 stop:2292 length:1011 start_codon:yes stop_codon:yes gene_type:complete
MSRGKFWIVVVIVLEAVLCFAAHGQATDARSPREIRAEQARVWSELDREVQRILAERSRYVYQFDEDLIIDAYPLLSWRQMLEDAVVREKVRAERRINGIRRTETVGYNWFYEVRPEEEAAFDIRSFPAMFWYRGVLLNDTTQGRRASHQVLVDASVNEVGDSAESKILSWMKRHLPLVAAIDPITRAEAPDSVYGLTGSGNDRHARLRAGLVVSARDGLRRMPMPRNGKVSYASLLTRYPIDPSSTRSDGKPDPGLESYLLLPAVRSVKRSGNVFTGGAQVSEDITYTIEPLKKYKLTAKELAVAWMEEKLEIPYRVIEKQGSELICVEHLLQRP